jgi:hypothetical protein
VPATAQAKKSGTAHAWKRARNFTVVTVAETAKAKRLQKAKPVRQFALPRAKVLPSKTAADLSSRCRVQNKLHGNSR